MMKSRPPRTSRIVHRPAHRTAHRRGFNLPELLFVIAALSALTVVVMTVIGLLISAEQYAAQSLWIDVTISSFATDLRADAHQALELQATADGEDRAASVTFLFPNESRVTYECVADGVVRRQSGPDGTATQTYRLALGSSTFQLPGAEGLLRFTHLRTIPSIGGFGQPPADAGGVQRTFHVATAIGPRIGADREDTR